MQARHLLQLRATIEASTAWHLNMLLLSFRNVLAREPCRGSVDLLSPSNNRENNFDVTIILTMQLNGHETTSLTQGHVPESSLV